MDFDVEKDINIFEPVFKKRPEINRDKFNQDLDKYYLPYLDKLMKLPKPAVVGISAIQGAGKTTQGEILEILLKNQGLNSVSLSIDDHYVTHKELCDLREKDPRYIRRGVTHDINLAISDLTKLKEMRNGDTEWVTHYDKGAFHGDGDRGRPRKVEEKPDFIFYDGWFVGARSVSDEKVFDQNLPALETPEDKQFAKDVNIKLLEYDKLWEMINFLIVLYVPHYEMALEWRENAEKPLRVKGEGMSAEQIKEFVYYFWRSVHPAIHIKNLAHDEKHTNLVAIIGDDHTVLEMRSPTEVLSKYP